MKQLKTWKYLSTVCASVCATLFVVLACASGDPKSQSAETMPDDFVVVADFIPDIIQEIRYHSTYNFVGERIVGYEEPKAILTRKAAEALKAVSDDVMAQGYRLKVYDA